MTISSQVPKCLKQEEYTCKYFICIPLWKEFNSKCRFFLCFVFLFFIYHYRKQEVVQTTAWLQARDSAWPEFYPRLFGIASWTWHIIWCHAKQRQFSVFNLFLQPECHIQSQMNNGKWIFRFQVSIIF